MKVLKLVSSICFLILLAVIIICWDFNTVGDEFPVLVWGVKALAIFVVVKVFKVPPLGV